MPAAQAESVEVDAGLVQQTSSARLFSSPLPALASCAWFSLSSDFSGFCLVSALRPSRPRSTGGAGFESFLCTSDTLGTLNVGDLSNPRITPQLHFSWERHLSCATHAAD